MTKSLKELKQKTEKELVSETVALRNEIARQELEKKANPQKDTNLIAKKRKKLAQVLTILNTIKNQ